MCFAMHLSTGQGFSPVQDSSSIAMSSSPETTSSGAQEPSQKRQETTGTYAACSIVCPPSPVEAPLGPLPETPVDPVTIAAGSTTSESSYTGTSPPSICTKERLKTSGMVASAGILGTGESSSGALGSGDLMAKTIETGLSGALGSGGPLAAEGPSDPSIGIEFARASAAFLNPAGYDVPEEGTLDVKGEAVTPPKKNRHE